jgi:hypothetical protein
VGVVAHARVRTEAIRGTGCRTSRKGKSGEPATVAVGKVAAVASGLERVMGIEPTTSCLGRMALSAS